MIKAVGDKPIISQALIGYLVCIDVATCFRSGENYLKVRGQTNYLKVRGQTDSWMDYIINQLSKNIQ